MKYMSFFDIASCTNVLDAFAITIGVELFTIAFIIISYLKVIFSAAGILSLSDVWSVVTLVAIKVFH